MFLYTIFNLITFRSESSVNGYYTLNNRFFQKYRIEPFQKSSTKSKPLSKSFEGRSIFNRTTWLIFFEKTRYFILKLAANCFLKFRAEKIGDIKSFLNFVYLISHNTVINFIYAIAENIKKYLYFELKSKALLQFDFKNKLSKNKDNLA